VLAVARRTVLDRVCEDGSLSQATRYGIVSMKGKKKKRKKI
jgi:hypothetical protein